MSWHKSKTKNTKQTSKLISNDFYIRHFFVALVARVSVMWPPLSLNFYSRPTFRADETRIRSETSRKCFELIFSTILYNKLTF